ncbi:hypothetical protein HBI06_045970 [Parastagonospora nodorum]|nr:hypothetical protein HBI06_045970 [Parastagonospora nodorum]KAH4248215.1 hypothetical protein HBI05_016320 [Parastagonospora nodorum]
MATTTLNRTDAACQIHKLPTELLENVLLYAVSHVNSPGMDEHGRLRNISAPGPSTILNFRSTCRKFRDASYRALAKVIGETIYDLRSKISIQNLETLSKTAQLARWVTKLTFSCLIVNESFPIQLKGFHDTLGPALTKLHPEIRQEYAQVKVEEEAWYSEIWPPASDFELLVQSQPRVLVFYQSTQCTLGQTLVECIERMANLDHFQYSWANEQTSPGRYRKLRSLGVGEMKGACYPDPTASALHAHLGLEILISAIAKSKVRPRTLELAVELHESHTFITNCPESLVAAACSEVQNLLLLNSYDLQLRARTYRGRLPPPSRASINKSNFPALKNLTLYHNNRIGINPGPLPLPSEVPALQRLVILDAVLAEPDLLSFIRLYGMHVEQLVLRRSCYDWDLSLVDLYNAMGYRQLKHLTIDVSWAGLILHQLHKWRTYDDAIFAQMPQDLVKSLAKEVTVLPVEFARVLEEYWGENGLFHDEIEVKRGHAEV